MAIISISRGTFSGGETLAECIAGKLGYRCISRQILVDAAVRYGSPIEKLSEAVEQPPRFLEGLATERAHYIAFLRAALCKAVKEDNVVYHGHAGHFLIKGIPHLIRVRLNSSTEVRIQNALERNPKLKREEAIELIKKVDESRSKWAKFLYHADWQDPSIYDIVVNIDILDMNDACDVISYATGLDKFKTTPEGQKIVDDMVLSSDVRAIIAMNRGISDSGIEIEADDGAITLGGTTRSLQDADKIRDIVRSIPGVKTINSKMQVKIPW